MYSRYQPFEPMENLLHGAREPERPALIEREPHAATSSRPLRSLMGRGGGPLSGLLKNLKLDLDAGDILLLLIILFMSQECDDMELVIILGLVLFMGL